MSRTSSSRPTARSGSSTDDRIRYSNLGHGKARRCNPAGPSVVMGLRRQPSASNAARRSHVSSPPATMPVLKAPSSISTDPCVPGIDRRHPPSRSPWASRPSRYTAQRARTSSMPQTRPSTRPRRRVAIGWSSRATGLDAPSRSRRRASPKSIARAAPRRRRAGGGQSLRRAGLPPDHGDQRERAEEHQPGQDQEIAPALPARERSRARARGSRPRRCT